MYWKGYFDRVMGADGTKITRFAAVIMHVLINRISEKQFRTGRVCEWADFR